MFKDNAVRGFSYLPLILGEFGPGIKCSSSARKSLKFCRSIVAIQNSFKKLLSAIYVGFIKFFIP